MKLRNRRHRDATGRFIIEGRIEIERAIGAGIEILDLFVDVTRGASIVGSSDITTVAPTAFERMAYRQSPDGYLAVARTPRTGLDDLTTGEDALILIVEAVEKPGNLGTMLRTADATGVAAVIVCDQATDLYGPNVVRASLGCLFTVPVAIAVSDAAIDWCRRHDVKIVATTPHTDRVYTDVNLTGRLAIVVGAEHSGLSAAWLEAAAERVRMPMMGGIDSLNAASTAAVALYESLRQRRVLGPNSVPRPQDGPVAPA
ncbi:MAG: RNA methyltransferase [Acidimicrobiia bacterium]|nr:RNA methyltransferase [Acidimicrobiia bacterium]